MLTIPTTSYSPLIHLKTNLPTFTSNNVSNLNIDNNGCYASGRGYYCIFSSNHPIIRKRVLRTSSSNQGVVETSLTSVDSASTVVRKFYQGINGRDLASVENLIAENCVYEDLIFPQPFVGRKAILDFFNKFIDSISTDLQFVIDNISEDGVSGVGVTWHMVMGETVWSLQSSLERQLWLPSEVSLGYYSSFRNWKSVYELWWEHLFDYTSFSFSSLFVFAVLQRV